MKVPLISTTHSAHTVAGYVPGLSIFGHVSRGVAKLMMDKTETEEGGEERKEGRRGRRGGEEGGEELREGKENQCMADEPISFHSRCWPEVYFLVCPSPV